MQVSFLKELFDHMDPWFYEVVGVVLILALIVFFYFTFYGMKKFVKAIKSVVDRDDRIKEMQEQMDRFKDHNTNNEMIASQLSSIIVKTTPFIEALNNIRVIESYEGRISESLNIVQKVLESLSSDIKNQAGENHRCGIWLIDQDYLRLYFTSAGFPRNYINNRVLHKDRTIAGKCFRKKQTIHLDDVSSDTDWEQNPEGKSPYKSVICIPLNINGVLTVDGLKPMSKESVSIAEMYCAVIEGAMMEYYRAFDEQSRVLNQLNKRLEMQPEIG